MLLSFHWLKQYIPLPNSISAEEVARQLQFSTVEVEKIIHQGEQLNKVIVGKIVSCEKHPNADKLKVCLVDVGGEKITIICGGSNVTAGLLVVVALSGSKVKWHGEGELVELKPTVIRGLESNGMICAADEIGLLEMFPKKEEKEIVDLSSLAPADKKRFAIKPGMPLAAVLDRNDTIFEIDNKSLSNRPDLWGHYGVAREIAALFKREVKTYPTKNFKKMKGQVEMKLKITVEDAQLCPRYMAVAMSGIVVGPSPVWLQSKLQAVGLRSINNVVDITNYVMLDLGQPMHAFDANQLLTIHIRHATVDEVLTTLDGQRRALDPSMLVIASADRPIAVAGVMGGVESSVTNGTTTIIFESANFDASTIRQTSTKLGLRTDSSARFEKSLDPQLCAMALARAMELLQEICPSARVISKVMDEGKLNSPQKTLKIESTFFTAKLGLEIPAPTIINILRRLGFGVVAKKNVLQVTVPSWRQTKDISIPEDIVEEVARIYGYDKIPATLPTFPITPPLINELSALTRKITRLLVSQLAYSEVYNYSFVSEAQIKRLGDNQAFYLELDNPLSQEKPYLRRNLLGNLLENIASNIDYQASLKLFEIGKVFLAEEAGPRAESNSDELLPRQDTWLTAVVSHQADQVPFWASRQVAKMISRELSLFIHFVKANSENLTPWQHPARTAILKCGEITVGQVFELHPRVASAYGLKERVGICSFNLTLLTEMVIASQFNSDPADKSVGNYQPSSLYPQVKRDIAFVVKKDITNAAIVSALSGLDPLIKKVELFDVFEKPGTDTGYKSMAYAIVYSSFERTLMAAEINAIEQKITDVLLKQFEAEMRG